MPLIDRKSNIKVNMNTNILKKQIERSSNIELLRIISMFLVLIIHYVPHRENVTWENFCSFPLESSITLFLKSISFVCVNAFILISGYFSIKWKWKSFSNLIFQIAFWTIFSSLFTHIFFNKDISLNECFFNIYSNWFIRAYLCLYMFAPVLNAYIEKSSNKQLGIFLLIFYAVQTILGWMLQTAPEFHEGMSFVSLSGLYLIGAFIKRMKSSYFTFNKYCDLAIYFGGGLILAIINVAALKYNITSSPYGYLNPIVIVQTMYLFLFFTKIRIENNIINWIASSSFAVYLFHYSYFTRDIFHHYCEIIEKSYKISLPYIICYLIVIFIISVLVDKIRIVIFKQLSRINFKTNENPTRS